MRLRSVIFLLMAVNVLWASAFLGYLRRGDAPPAGRPSRTIGLVTTSPPPVATILPTAPAAPVAVPTASNPPPAVAASLPTNAPPAAPVESPTGRTTTADDVTTPEYPRFLNRLRAAGLPPQRIRDIVVADVNEQFDKRRLQQAVELDEPWWKSGQSFGRIGIGFGMAPGANSNLEDTRRDLIEKLLGEDELAKVKLPTLSVRYVTLTGKVLGGLPIDRYNTVQEICGESSSRYQNLWMAQMQGGQGVVINGVGGIDQIELAKIRERTRTELSKVLSPDELTEFLLRYSHNGQNLRQQLAGFDVTPEEFRKIFVGVDPIDHRLSLQYGTADVLSPKQREEIQRQRERAISEALGAERYQQYQRIKDPAFQQAQMVAQQFGASAEAVPRLFELQQAFQRRQQAILTDTKLTPDQRNSALSALHFEHQEKQRKVIQEAATPKR